MRPRRFVVLAAGTAALVIVAAVVLRPSRGPATVTEPPDAPSRALTDPQDPSTSISSRDSQGTANAHSEHGAVAAAADLVIAYDSPAILDDQSRSDLIDSTAALDHRTPLTETFSDAAEMLQDRLALSDEAVDDPGFVWRSIPAGWAVHEYSRLSATVAIWGTGLLLGDGRSLTRPKWTTMTVELVWERDDWRLASFHRTEGPAPAPLGDPDGGSAGRRINGFAPFSYWPAPAKAGR